MVTNIQLIYEHPIDRIIFGRASPQVKKVVYEALQDKPQVLRKIIDRAAIEGSYLAKIIALKQHEAVDVIFEAAKNHPHLLDGVLAENDDSAATLYRHLNSGELKAATLLLMAGADHRYRPDENHSTVFDLAVLHGAQEAVEVLKQRDPKAMISMRTSQGYFNSVHQDEIFYADYFARKWGYQPSYLKEEKPGVLKEFPITKIPLTDDPILIEVGDPQGRDTSATILASGLEVTAKLKAEDSSHYVLDEERRPLSAEKIGKLKNAFAFAEKNGVNNVISRVNVYSEPDQTWNCITLKFVKGEQGWQMFVYDTKTIQAFEEVALAIAKATGLEIEEASNANHQTCQGIFTYEDTAPKDRTPNLLLARLTAGSLIAGDKVAESNKAMCEELGADCLPKILTECHKGDAASRTHGVSRVLFDRTEALSRPDEAVRSPRAERSKVIMGRA